MLCEELKHCTRQVVFFTKLHGDIQWVIVLHDLDLLKNSPSDINSGDQQHPPMCRGLVSSLAVNLFTRFQVRIQVGFCIDGDCEFVYSSLKQQESSCIGVLTSSVLLADSSKNCFMYSVINI